MILLTPGPTPVPREVREAMARPIIHHRTPEYQALQGECDEALQRVFRTGGPVLTLSGSGTAGFEAAQLSLARPGDTVIACSCGRFGRRWQETFDRQARHFAMNVVRVDAPWGEPVRPEAVHDAIDANPDVAIVTLVHSETSTATASDLRAVAAVVRERAPRALLLVDAISSLAALPIEMNAWGVDVVVSGSQKALMMSPGLAFVALGERAIERLGSTPAHAVIAPYYLDLRAHLKGHATRTPPFTPAVSLVFGLRAALTIIEREGVEAAWAATSERARATRAALRAMGLRLASSAPSDSVTSAFYPDGVGDELREACVRLHAVRFAGGQESWKGRVLRISHMGAVTSADTIAGVEAIAAELRARGGPGAVDPDAGVAMIRSQLAAATV